MGQAWSTEQVLALAPDVASVAAARGLARASAWGSVGAGEGALWGECQGSGRVPYASAVDLSGPAFRCSCPSRKFPCKHCLALLLLWAAGGVRASTPPDGVTAWLAQRARRAEGAEQSEHSDGPADPQAAARRAEQRTARMSAGLDDLGRWLLDRVRAGFAGVERDGYVEFDTVAARLVDAQVPGLASVLRRLPGVVASGEGWPQRLLEEYALLHLAVAAHAPSGTDDTLRDTLRAHLGVPVPQASVLARPAVRDRWTVLAVRDTAEDRLVTRKAWLAGRSTGRLATVLAFAPIGSPLDASLVPGQTLDADLHLYPGGVPLRAAVGTRYPAGTDGGTDGGTNPPDVAAADDPRSRTPLAATELDAAHAAWADALARDPWLWSWPALLAEATLRCDDRRCWWVVDSSGHAAPAVLEADQDPWELVAAGGGHPLPMLVEVTARGVRPIAVLAGETVALHRNAA